MHSEEQYRLAHFYDLFGTDRVDSSDATIGFFLHYALRAGSALELGAGTGRVAIPLAHHRVQTVGIEPSAMMRAACLTKTAQHPEFYPYLTILPGDARRVRLNRLFPLIYATGVSMHWLNDADWLAVLETVRMHLDVDGIFLVDGILMNVPSRIDEPLSLVSSVKLGEIEYRTSFGRSWLTESLYQFHARYQVIHQGQVIEQLDDDSTGSFMTLTRLEELCATAGLKITHSYGDYRFGDIEEDSTQIIAKLRKRQ
jgi:SAM-dependent methyltransferase